MVVGEDEVFLDMAMNGEGEMVVLRSRKGKRYAEVLKVC